MNRYSLKVEETIATLVVDGDHYALAELLVNEARNEILEYIDGHPEFETSFTPLSVSSKAGPVVQRMSSSSHKIGVGPMASVAGCIAQYVVEELVNIGVRHVIFENGGDIAMFLEQPSVVGIYSGYSSSLGLGLRITTTDQVLGICTSSGTIGHSMSFGFSDASIVISNDVALADAAATALGNQILSENQEHVATVMREMMSEDIEGLMVVIGDLVGTCGNLPEIVKANVDYALISKG
ncbi:MAG: UPF0280 family protein [Candidatus Thorarchaeota archaeon]|nr:UPF0280 family protein [Candidatus Thorarchaeota archaeon]